MKRPLALKIVAGLLILEGIDPLLSAVALRRQPPPEFDLAFLGSAVVIALSFASLFVYLALGILRFKESARVLVVAGCWFLFVILAAFGIGALFAPQKVTVQIGPISTTAAQSPLLALTIFLLGPVVVLWVVRVLTRQNIRELFAPNRKPA